MWFLGYLKGMPITLNFATEKLVWHVPVPLPQQHEVRERLYTRLKDACPTGIQLTRTPEDMLKLRSGKLRLPAGSDTFWQALGSVIAYTREPWWDFVILVEDDRIYLEKKGIETGKAYPHAHALSLYRVTAEGEGIYLHVEPPFTG